ncbi:MAG: ACP S-malonyltransferase [Clostridiales bacterium]|nr:ACP S-malonyltransferase [Clostridiales bacterium]
MGKLAFIFAGQGAQKPGMGKELYDSFDCAKKVFDEANEALGFDVTDMIFNGDQDTLMITENTQPTIVTMSTAALRVLEEKGIRPDMVAGLSLGEYTAHVASGSMSFADAVRLVKKRGKYMQEEVPVGKGAMAAIIALDADTVRECCREASELGVCTGANFNCPGQIVVSGDVAAVDRCCEIAKEKGAKRAMRLAVSAPFHCALLEGAGEKLARELENVEVRDMQIPVITNVTADYVPSKEDIKPTLIKQVSNSVLWEDSIRKMISDGADTFVEIGPGKALCGFLKKIDKNVRAFNVEDLASLEKTLEGLKEEM